MNRTYEPIMEKKDWTWFTEPEKDKRREAKAEERRQERLSRKAVANENESRIKILK